MVVNTITVAYDKRDPRSARALFPNHVWTKTVSVTAECDFIHNKAMDSVRGKGQRSLTDMIKRRFSFFFASKYDSAGTTTRRVSFILSR